ncbi:hypothetical protein EJB05_50899, partial [Eragrostis curvula]
LAHPPSHRIPGHGVDGDPGARKHLRVLLPFSRNSLRIPDELAGGDRRRGGRLHGKKVWPVEVGQDGDGAFLGRGWRAFADACGVGGGWLLALRLRGRVVLTVKAFDDGSGLRELGAPIPPAGNRDSLAWQNLCWIEFLSDFLSRRLSFRVIKSESRKWNFILAG